MLETQVLTEVFRFGRAAPHAAVPRPANSAGATLLCIPASHASVCNRWDNLCHCSPSPIRTSKTKLTASHDTVSLQGNGSGGRGRTYMMNALTGRWLAISPLRNRACHAFPHDNLHRRVHTLPLLQPCGPMIECDPSSQYRTLCYRLCGESVGLLDTYCTRSVHTFLHEEQRVVLCSSCDLPTRRTCSDKTYHRTFHLPLSQIYHTGARYRSWGDLNKLC
jgi:hypothetical protein